MIGQRVSCGLRPLKPTGLNRDQGSLHGEFESPPYLERVRYSAHCAVLGTAEAEGKGHPLWPKGRGLESHLHKERVNAPAHEKGSGPQGGERISVVNVC